MVVKFITPNIAFTNVLIKKNKKQDMNKQKQSNELGVVFIVTDSSNYYQEPVTVRIFSTKEKAISFCDKKDPNRKYLDWEEFEVE